MTKLFELLGTVIATACLVQIASNPGAALRDIERGPMPELAKFNRSLYHPRHKNVRVVVTPLGVSSCKQ